MTDGRREGQEDGEEEIRRQKKMTDDIKGQVTCCNDRGSGTHSKWNIWLTHGQLGAWWRDEEGQNAAWDHQG